jgi:hypothetical protein
MSTCRGQGESRIELEFSQLEQCFCITMPVATNFKRQIISSVFALDPGAMSDPPNGGVIE